MSKPFLSGIRDGVPIGLGYLTVGFSVGITAHNTGLTPLQGFVMSLLNLASSGEYAGLTVMGADSGFIEMIIISLIINARYILMSCALSQKLSPGLSTPKRLLIGYGVTDEIFGAAIARPGFVEAAYYYGTMLVPVFCWSVGTLLGVIFGELLPARLASAFSVMLFGMFIAVVIPAGKKNYKVLICVIVSFLASLGLKYLPLTASLSSGTKIILLTVVISVAAALIFPRTDEDESKEAEAVKKTK